MGRLHHRGAPHRLQDRRQHGPAPPLDEEEPKQSLYGEPAAIEELSKLHELMVKDQVILALSAKARGDQQP